MMKNIAVVVCMLAGVIALTAQQRVPDEEDILARIVDGSSEYYYPSLMLRYEAGDTTLTFDDYHYLYYGYAYQEAYRPLEPIEGEAELLMVLERSPEPSFTEASELLHYAKVVMEADPFSPKNLNFMAYAYSIMGDTLNAQVNMDRMEKIFATIASSGTGLRENSPWHVLWFSHASDMVASMGLEILGRQVRTRTVEYIKIIRNNSGDPKGYFFDFGRMYWRRPENTPKRQKRVSGFELNGIPIGGKHSTQAPDR